MAWAEIWRRAGRRNRHHTQCPRFFCRNRHTLPFLEALLSHVNTCSLPFSPELINAVFLRCACSLPAEMVIAQCSCTASSGCPSCLQVTRHPSGLGLSLSSLSVGVGLSFACSFACSFALALALALALAAAAASALPALCMLFCLLFGLGLGCSASAARRAQRYSDTRSRANSLTEGPKDSSTSRKGRLSRSQPAPFNGRAVGVLVLLMCLLMRERFSRSQTQRPLNAVGGRAQRRPQQAGDSSHPPRPAARARPTQPTSFPPRPVWFIPALPPHCRRAKLQRRGRAQAGRRQRRRRWRCPWLQQQAVAAASA